MGNFEKVGEFELKIEEIVKPMTRWTIILTLFVLVLQFVIHQNFTFTIINFLIGTLIVILLYILFMFLHEICHLIGFVLFGHAPLKSLKMGVNLQMGVAYATTTKLMPNKAMRKALLLPFWVTGVVPTICGIYFDYTPLTLVGAWLMVGAIGDFYMYKQLKHIDDAYYIQDDTEHPKLHFYTKKLETD